MPTSPRVAITHTIEQHFDRPVRLSTHWLRLRPAPQTRARITAYSLAIDAGPYFLNWVRDPFENYLARLDLPEPLTQLGIALELIAELAPINPFDFLTEPYAAKHPFEYPEQLKKELAPYLHLATLVGQGPHWSAFTRQFERDTMTTTERLDSVNRIVHRARGEGARSEPGLVDPELALAGSACSPWQLAWLLTLSLRHYGLAARFVSGLRVTLAEADGGDFAARHAWSEVFLPGAGWIGLDPDAGLFCNETYIPFAAATDPLRTLPIAGFIEACQETQTESLRARRLVPVPRSWPFSETAWHDIRALGDSIDADLAASGVKPALALSLSFVAHPALAPEWNTAALGPSKRWAAELLLQRLLPRMAAGGLLHESQGQWWSGEPLPRWRWSGFFRTDGAPLWRESSTREHADARSFAEALARALQLPPSAIAPAYEDGLAARCQARAGALELEPAELRDPARRRALANRLSAADASEPTGYVIPIRHDDTTNCWVTKPWAFRRDRLYLVPGSSPLGYRLPLESLVEDEQHRVEAQLEHDPFDPREPLAPALAPSGALASGSAPRTAIGVERRDGSLRVFLPPVSRLEHYLQLLAAVETAAGACQCAVRLEGYEPPEDPRLARIVLEPEPGALRLQLPQTTSFRAHVAAIEAAYDEAGRVGLYAERPSFDPSLRMPSGRSRIAIAGPSPAESPFLTRPAILRQLIACFQKHPSLSYAFAGKSIGPSGVAPRPDEGRDEALYELSLALERLPDQSGEALWQADRILRHLLVDPAGDPKRAELRVDQLYAPDRAGMRQGRVTVNAFETAPDPRIAALQSLLVLGLIARFAKLPSDSELARWGAELHDRFMLPSVLCDDLARVLEGLQAAGYPFQSSWFEPLVRLRFPVLGVVPIGTITLELRAAHEPWPLLAEEVTAAGVARFVDAATERLQVKLTGIAAERHVLKCNCERVPLQPMAANGEFVAGVRYKVANPPATLHPTLAPVTTLVFDVIDTWTGRVIGGCTYHPAQRSACWPGGSTAGAPVQPLDPKGAAERVPLPPITLLLPGGQSGGRFVPHGSGDAWLPPKRMQDERPYLLDMTQSS